MVTDSYCRTVRARTCVVLQDFLRVAPGFMSMYKIGGVKKHDGFSGVLGCVVGLIGTCKVLKKCNAAIAAAPAAPALAAATAVAADPANAKAAKAE